MLCFRQIQIEILLIANLLAFPQIALSAEFYGPVNLLKTMPTPFGPPLVTKPDKVVLPNQGLKSNGNEFKGPSIRFSSSKTPNENSQATALNEAPIVIDTKKQHQGNLSLKQRLVTSRLYLPGRMVLGKSATFSISGRPGCYMAVAMADKNKGAKPIYGHDLHLGADRKVIAVGRIPTTGLLTFSVETPIQGDLIGQLLYFEAAIWTKDDFSDVELATPVSSEGQEGVYNGVLIATDSEPPKGIKFVPDAAVPLQQRETPASTTLGTRNL